MAPAIQALGVPDSAEHPSLRSGREPGRLEPRRPRLPAATRVLTPEQVEGSATLRDCARSSGPRLWALLATERPRALALYAPRTKPIPSTQSPTFDLSVPYY